MEILYNSTRSEGAKVKASEAILKGLSEDGGLFVPESIPALDKSLEELADMTYGQVAYEVMKLYLTDFTEEELKNCIAKAYDEKFDTEEIAPLVSADGAYYLELFHGATIAFKDMALSILPHLLTTSAKKNNVKNEIVILTATSGDTGKAALAGFADVEGTRIVVFYPKNGVSPIQEKQMVTQKGKNTYVVGIHGNFDDAQTGVKKIFGDKELAEYMNEKGFQFSSANSINWGRLVPQITYYFSAYADLLASGEIESGEEVNFCVPSGNFGNILAGYPTFWRFYPCAEKAGWFHRHLPFPATHILAKKMIWYISVPRGGCKTSQTYSCDSFLTDLTLVTANRSSLKSGMIFANCFNPYQKTRHNNVPGFLIDPA